VRFDPAIAAQRSFQRAQAIGELGSDHQAVTEAEETFSAGAGSEAKGAYLALQKIGERHPGAAAFQEFLIYITWQQAAEETIPAHFRKGVELCDRYLQRWGQVSGQAVEQIRELRASFRSGLGLDDDDPHDYEQDTIKGGD
jgi:hypothetical protein